MPWWHHLAQACILVGIATVHNDYSIFDNETCVFPIHIAIHCTRASNPHVDSCFLESSCKSRITCIAMHALLFDILFFEHAHVSRSCKSRNSISCVNQIFHSAVNLVSINQLLLLSIHAIVSNPFGFKRVSTL